MSVYLVVSYDVTNPVGFAEYQKLMPVVAKTLTDAGGRLVAAGPPDTMKGDKRHVGIVAEFPTREAIDTWLNHPEYAAAKAIREANTTNYSIFVLGSFPPAA